MLMLLFVTIWQQSRSCHSFKSSEDATSPYQQLINTLHSRTGSSRPYQFHINPLHAY